MPRKKSRSRSRSPARKSYSRKTRSRSPRKSRSTSPLRRRYTKPRKSRSPSRRYQRGGGLRTEEEKKESADKKRRILMEIIDWLWKNTTTWEVYFNAGTSEKWNKFPISSTDMPEEWRGLYLVSLSNSGLNQTWYIEAEQPRNMAPNTVREKLLGRFVREGKIVNVRGYFGQDEPPYKFKVMYHFEFAK